MVNSNPNPDPPRVSKEASFLSNLLSGAVAPKTVGAKEAVLSQQVTDAIATLETMTQFVINHRFGFGGGPSLPYDEIARRVTATLSPELRESIAKEEGIGVDKVVISPARIEELEKEGLRALRSRPSKRST